MRRILTAAILIPAIVALVLWGHVYVLAASSLVIAELGLWEFFRLAEASGAKPVRIAGYSFAVAVLGSVLPGVPQGARLAILVAVPSILLTIQIFSAADLRVFMPSVASTLLGVLYVAVPMALLVDVAAGNAGRYL